MTNRTDIFPPGLCGIPEKEWMKRKKLEQPFGKTKRWQGGCIKMATGGSPFAPLRSAGQPTENLVPGPVNGSARIRVTVVRLVGPDCTPRLRPQDSIDR